MKKIECKICGKNFKKKSNAQIFCGIKCSKKGHKISRDRFNHSVSGKERKRIYAKSKKGQLAIKIKQQRYEQTVEGIKTRKKYKQSYKGKTSIRFHTNKRRILAKKQTPKWNDSKKTREIYNYAAKIEKIFGFPVHVDHIVPLQGITFEDGAKVSGLNVWYNLDITTPHENVSKLNLCPPVYRQKNYNKKPHLALIDLPKPKDWMKRIRTYYLDALAAKKMLKENPKMLQKWNNDIFSKPSFTKNPRYIKK